MEEMVYKTMREYKILDSGEYLSIPYWIISHGFHPCAYVQVPKDNKFFRKHYDDIDIMVHGGLTFSENHLPQQEDTENWYIGWDYNHAGDFSGMAILYSLDMIEGKKWTTEEIKEDVKKVCNQLLEA